MRFDASEVHVTPMSADTHAFNQRLAEWAKNNPPEEEEVCAHCGRVREDIDEESSVYCEDCAAELMASQHADAADRQRDEKWADQWESAHDAG